MQDLREYGFIPEFIGRFPVITYVDPLDETALLRILTEPQDSLTAQYQEVFRQDGITLSFTPKALAAIAHEAFTLGTGARGLRGIMEKVMMDIMFNAPGKAKHGCKEICITHKDVEKKTCNPMKNAG